MNIKDSVLFLLFARQTINEMIHNESNLNKTDKSLAEKYIMIEASDYEIISILQEGKFPETRYNHDNQIKLFKSLKESINLDKNIDKEIKQCIVEVGSLNEIGLSSSASTMSYIVERGRYNDYEDDEESAGSKALGAAAKVGNMAITAHMMRPAKGYVQTVKDIPGQIKAAPGKVMASLKAGRTAAMNGVASVNRFVRTPLGKGLGAAVIVSLIALAATKIYRDKLSKAARSCSKFSGPEKKQCMYNFKRAAIQSQIGQLKSGMSSCNSVKDPNKCKQNIIKKINKLQNKI